MEQTHENIVAMRLRALAKEMNSTAHEMRLLGTKPAKQHAKEMDGAAKIAREWAREIKASNAPKLTGAPHNERNDSDEH